MFVFPVQSFVVSGMACTWLPKIMYARCLGKALVSSVSTNVASKSVNYHLHVCWVCQWPNCLCREASAVLVLHSRSATLHPKSAWTLSPAACVQAPTIARLLARYAQLGVRWLGVEHRAFPNISVIVNWTTWYMYCTGKFNVAIVHLGQIDMCTFTSFADMCGLLHSKVCLNWSERRCTAYEQVVLLKLSVCLDRLTHSWSWQWRTGSCVHTVENGPTNTAAHS